MGLQLTGLDDVFALEAQAAANNNGKPLMLALDDIELDPTQPRKKIDQEKLKALSIDIKARGVKSPISVKPKNERGKYPLNFGERRWRASHMAGLTEIPAFIDEKSDGYSQMAENIHRDDLAPVEIGDWILSRMKDFGETQQQIADGLAMSKTWVSRHAKIAQAPDQVRVAGDKCDDYTAIVELVTAYEQFPQQTVDFINSRESIGRKDVAAFMEQCRAPSTDAGLVPQGAEESGQIGAGTGQESANVAPQETPSTDLSAASPGDGAGAAVESGETKEAPAASVKTAGPASAPRTSVLGSIYEAQTVRQQPLDAIFADLDDDSVMKAFRTLTKAHKKGRSSGQDNLAVGLAQGLAAGEFAGTGEKMYAMLAFIDGALHKGEFDMERMKEKCFKVVETMMNPG